MNATRSNSLGKLVCLGLLQVKTVEIIFLAYIGRVLQNLRIRKCKFFKDLKISGVSKLLFGAIEPTQKERNNWKFKTPYLSGNQTSWVLSSCVKTFEKLNLERYFLAGNSKGHLEYTLWKLVIWVWLEFETLKSVFLDMYVKFLSTWQGKFKVFNELFISVISGFFFKL